MVADLRGDAAGSRTAGRRWTLRDGAGWPDRSRSTALLLVVAALLTRSLVAAQRTSVRLSGPSPAIVSTDTGLLRYTEARSRQFYDQAVARVSAIPGVESAALGHARASAGEPQPLGDLESPATTRPAITATSSSRHPCRRTTSRRSACRSSRAAPSPTTDRPDTPWVAIVNETMAPPLLAGPEARFGKTLRSRASDGPSFEIVGIRRITKC